MINDKLLEKIQKLLSLANSPNEEEAKAAMRKANELLLKYNLSMQHVESHQNDYVVKDQVDSGLTLKHHHSFISDIVRDFFFVKVHIVKEFVGVSSGEHAYRNRPRNQFKKIVQLVGTKENVQIASYIFEYLDKLYPELWKNKYERDASLETKHRVSYYAGLTKGITKVLEETKWKVQEETGLVLVEDPQLKSFSDDITNGKKHKGSIGWDMDHEVALKGLKDGMNITLRKPIESKQNESDVLMLESSQDETTN